MFNIVTDEVIRNIQRNNNNVNFKTDRTMLYVEKMLGKIKK